MSEPTTGAVPNGPLPSAGAGNPASHLDVVLERIGRAATPAVAESPFGLSLGRLLGLPDAVEMGTVLVVGDARTAEAVSSTGPMFRGLPGVLAEQAAITGVTTLVIDWAAFDHGPWLGADSHVAHALSREIFEAGRILRSRGGLVLGLLRAGPQGSTTALLRSTCTVDLGDIPPEDLEEHAPNSALWTSLVALHSMRRSPDAAMTEEVYR